MGTQRSHGCNNNKGSYTAVLHRYIESQVMPSRYEKESNNHKMGEFDHSQARPGPGDVSPETTSSFFTDKGSFDFKAHPNLPGIPVPYQFHVECKPERDPVESRERVMRRDVFNFLEGHKTFASRVYHHFM